MGFGRTISRVVLGEPLRVSVALMLDAGESLEAPCVSAEVHDGDNLIPASKVQVSLASSVDARGPSAQIRTSVPIVEPVATLHLTVACQFNVKRNFVFLADPPSWQASAEQESLTEQIRQTVVAPEQRTTLPRVVARSEVPSPPAVSQPASASIRKTPTRRQAVPEAVRPASSRSSLSITPRNAAPLAPRLILDPVETDASVKPDLRMSNSLSQLASEPETVSPELQQRRAAAAALWQAMNLSPEEVARDRQKLLAQERVLSQLSSELPPVAPAVAPPSTVASAPSVARGLNWMAYALGLAAVAGVWLSVRFMRQMRQRTAAETDWRPSHLDEAVSDMPSPSDVLIQESLIPQQWPSQREAQDSSGFDHPGSSSAIPADPTVKAPPPGHEATRLSSLIRSEESRSARTISSASHHRHGAVEPMRAVSVEELIDLEQQADFFVVLGQDDAAIELLESHIVAATASPLPFLKLLEIYQRLGKHEDYERIQATFNQRFNAHAPAWGSDLQHGHELADYPEVIERLQALWPAPFKAMEVLEKSLSRPESHDDTFDLPAYRELLLLYSVARDLSEREVDVRPRVDLFEALPTAPARMDQELPVLDGVIEPSAAEPLMATRPVKAVPNVQPTLSLDLQLDELTPTAQPSAMTSTLEVEHIDLPTLVEPGTQTASDHKP